VEPLTVVAVQARERGKLVARLLALADHSCAKHVGHCRHRTSTPISDWSFKETSA